MVKQARKVVNAINMMGEFNYDGKTTNNFN